MTNKLILIGLLTFGLACSSGITLAADDQKMTDQKMTDHKMDAKTDKASAKHKHDGKEKKHHADHHDKHHMKKSHSTKHSEKRAHNKDVSVDSSSSGVVSGTPSENFEAVRESEEGQMSDRSYND